MNVINNKFCAFADDSRLKLLISEVTSCISDEKIFGTVSVDLTISEALALAQSLIDLVNKTASPARIALEKARGNLHV